MFNKKTRRNFRQRKEASSEDEDEQKDNIKEEGKPEAAPIKKLPHASQSRGISCSSKREETPPKPHSRAEDDGETFGGAEEAEGRKTVKEGIKKQTKTVLSFSDDKEGKSTYSTYIQASTRDVDEKIWYIYFARFSRH